MHACTLVRAATLSPEGGKPASSRHLEISDAYNRDKKQSGNPAYGVLLTFAKYKAFHLGAKMCRVQRKISNPFFFRLLGLPNHRQTRPATAPSRALFSPARTTWQQTLIVVVQRPRSLPFFGKLQTRHSPEAALDTTPDHVCKYHMYRREDHRPPPKRNGTGSR